ncbi:murein biosynthesis integral membrane protein MurJ [Paenibacillus sp. Soil787]|uniref:murein biosynthesis integral membrane protein MurJ n=1 Tax=Paenibacillus sp. Soil787 TaxID=1736411 RepID=UPI0006FFADAC|nr:murein biosynthesis integral membrane protein MurJ [Paenibacillus sp. Soil787]KRF35875.1 hypothetical protein ASG93_25670 [Paenibacillus sp. Soil787]
MSTLNKNTTALFAITIFLAVVAKISGMIREVVIGYYYGASAELDLFYYIYTFPEVLMTGITAALSIALIPFLSGKEDFNVASNKLFLSKVLSIGTFIFVLITLIAIIFHKPILQFALNDMPKMNNQQSVYILWVSCFQLVPTFICAVYLAVGTKLEKYKLITLIGIPLNITSIVVMMILHNQFGVLSIGIGLLSGLLIQMIYLMWDLRRQGVGYSLKTVYSLKNSKLLEFSYLLLPVYLGTILQRLGVFVDRFLASGLQEGSISALSYADRVIQMVVMIIVSSIGMIMFSKISETIHNKKQETMELLSNTINFSCLTIIPISLFIIIFSKDIVTVLFARGEFDNIALENTSLALSGYSIGLIGIGLRYVLNRVYFAELDVKTPTMNTLYALIINIVLSVVLCRLFGIFGIALSGSLTMIAASVMLGFRLQTKHRYFSNFDWLEFAKILVLSIVLSIIWWVTGKMLSSSINSPLFRICSATIISIPVFIIVSRLLKLKEYDKLQQVFVARIRIKKKLASRSNA